MFDTYRLGTPDVHVHHNVTEKRAPTDESVRLLREMEQAAEKKVLETIRVANTVSECVVHVMRDDFSDTTKYRCIYKLSGARRTVNYEHVRGRNVERGAGLRGLCDAVAKDIAVQLVSGFITQAGKFWEGLE